MERRPSQKRAHEEAARWNQRHAVGTAVIVSQDNGQQLRTKTRSGAFVVSARAVVQVEGIAGSYLLSQVKPITEGIGDAAV